MAQSQAESALLSVRTTQTSAIQEKQQGKEDALASINDQLATIYSAARANPQDEEPPTLTRADYLKLYNSIHGYCVAGPRDDPKNRLRGAHLLGADLYRILEQELTAHCREVHTQIVTTGVQDHVVLIEAYITQWNKFTKLAGLIQNVMQFLERHWIKREIDEIKANTIPRVYYIQDLHRKCWKEEVLQVDMTTTDAAKVSKEILDAATSLQERDGEGAAGEKELIERFRSCLDSVNLTLPLSPEARGRWL